MRPSELLAALHTADEKCEAKQQKKNLHPGLFAKCFVQIITLSVVPALRLHREYEYSMNSTLKEP